MEWRRGESNPYFRLAKPACSRYHYAPGTASQLSCARSRDRGGGRGVDIDGVAHVLGVAAREHDADACAGAEQAVEHELVAGAQPGLGEREAAEAVALPRVRAREVERDLGRAAAQGDVERAVERLEVVGVAGAAGEVDVEVGGDALERVVARAVQRDRERVRVGAEEVGGAVALVDVAVDHERALGEAARAQLAERRHDVVEQAEAARERVARVVRAAAEVHRHAVLERVPRRRQRARHRAPRRARRAAGDHGSPSPRCSRTLSPPSRIRASSARVVHALEHRPRHRFGLVDLLGACDAVRDHPRPQQRVLVDREAMPRGEREAPAVVSPELHGGMDAAMALPAPSYGSTILITGASSGIGADLARQLAERGYNVTLVARRRERLEELAGELREAHDVHVDVETCDLGSPAARGRLTKKLQEGEREVVGVCNNAGFGNLGNFLDNDLEQETDVVRVNVEAVHELTGAFLPRMVEQGAGAVLNVASTAAFQPLPGFATYAASKAFVHSFSEAVHSELSRHRRVGHVAVPGLHARPSSSRPRAPRTPPRSCRASPGWSPTTSPARRSRACSPASARSCRACSTRRSRRAGATCRGRCCCRSSRPFPGRLPS